MFHLCEELITLATNFQRLQRKAFVNRNLLLQEFSCAIHINRLLKNGLREKKSLQTQEGPVNL